jgi:hypothetical protein
MLLVVDQLELLAVDDGGETHGRVMGRVGSRGSVDEGVASDADDEGVRGFLAELFDRARGVKVLLTETTDEPNTREPTVGLEAGERGGGGTGGGGGGANSAGAVSSSRASQGLGGWGVVHGVVVVAPLSLRDAARLYCKVCPSLRTQRDRAEFLNGLVPQTLPAHSPTSAASGASAVAASASAKLSRRLGGLLGHGYPRRVIQAAFVPDTFEALKALRALIASNASAGGGGGTGGGGRESSRRGSGRGRSGASGGGGAASLRGEAQEAAAAAEGAGLLSGQVTGDSAVSLTHQVLNPKAPFSNEDDDDMPH